MKQTAFLFPGQGAQYPGIGKDFYEAFRSARDLFDEADELLSFGLSKIIFEGPEALLTETKHSQLAIFVTSAALLKTLQECIPELVPSVCAGLSLGEYTALFASGRLPFAETLELVRLRGSAMNKACESSQGAMSAVLGLSAVQVEEIVSALYPAHRVWVANFNCPGQTVISGTKEGVAAASDVLKANGAKRILPLQVHGAFHSGLMQPAQDSLAPAILEAAIQDSSIAFAMNVPGGFVESVEQIKDNLIRQVTHSVRWEQSIQAMMERELSLYLEIGCGKTLSGMNRKIGVTAPALSLDKVADLDGVVKLLEIGVR
jgi:[acyl-carrier-protein] S-malonyltransferase